MLSCSTIFLITANGEREILVSPLLLQSKEPPDVKSGKIVILFFYEHWIDEEYRLNLKQERIPDDHKTDSHLINYGQDFNKYYLGSLNIDFDTRRCWDWTGPAGKLDEREIEALVKALFDPEKKSRRITIFSPTRASDFNLGIIKTK
jgi:hypothetical protein